MIRPHHNGGVTKLILNGGYGIAVAKSIPFKKTYPMPQTNFQIDYPGSGDIDAITDTI